jgi:hypothetical protein
MQGSEQQAPAFQHIVKFSTVTSLRLVSAMAPIRIPARIVMHDAGPV